MRSLRLLLLGTTHLFTATVADQVALFQSKEYEEGKFGLYPRIRYISDNFKTPQANIVKWDPACHADQYFFLCPHGDGNDGVADNEPIILDERGQLIWHGYEKQTVNNMQVQRYKGEDFLTYWTGYNELRGHGAGVFKMFDQTYTLRYEVQAISHPDVAVKGDSHEFLITADNTALMTIYYAKPWDLKFKDRDDGWIWDCILQEIDIATNKLLFEWTASEHFTFDDMPAPTWDNTVGKKNSPWDWFHINSIEKDPKGNFLVSARYSNALHYINGTDGKVIWNLGGSANSFKDMSEGKATDFGLQHMARWRDDYTAITLFDNSAYWRKRYRSARGLKVGLDFEKMQVTVLQELHARDTYLSESQGSLQVLDNGNYFVGWGYVSAYSEYDPAGELLCETHFAPLYIDKGKVKPGTAQSYRVYKQSWRAIPKEPPHVKFAEGSMFVSWNGATEVQSWFLEGGELVEDGVKAWLPIGTVNRTGFESNTTLAGQDGLWSMYRLKALDARDRELGIWTVNAAGVVKPYIPHRTPFVRMQDAAPSLVGPLLIFACACLLVILNRPRIVSSTQRFLSTYVFGGPAQAGPDRLAANGGLPK